MPKYSDLFAKQPAPARGGRLSALSREELQAYVDDVAPTFAQRFGNEVRANAPPNYETGTLIERGQRDLARMGQPMTLDQAAVATAGVPGLGDVVGLAADARAVYDDPSWMNIGGAALGALPFVPAMAAIRAYHGSPHDFDKFDMSKIGTGEGAQAYGHGLYFAEAEDTAKAYRDQLSPYDIEIGGERVEFSGRDPKGRAILGSRFGLDFSPGGDLDEVYLAIQEGLERGTNPLQAFDREASAYIKTLDDELASATGPNFIARAKPFRDAEATRLAELRAKLAAMDVTVHPSKGRMYEVNINADPDDFLDWDRPLSDQPSGFYAAMKDQEKRFAIVTPDGKFATNTPLTKDDATEFIADFRRGYSRSGRDPNDWRIADYSDPSSLPDLPLPEAFGVRDRAAVDRLAAAGIPGIKYLDQGSRAAGEGSRNYVVFDDALIEIIRKYGLAAVLGGTGAFGLMSLQGGEDGTQPPL